MSYRLVEVYGDEGTCTLYGRTFPAECLVEDDDGIRILVTRDRSIPVRRWVCAHSNGAAAILVPATGHIVVEKFMACRVEDHVATAFLIPEEELTPSFGDAQELQYREMLGARDKALVDTGLLHGDFVHLHTHTEFSPLDGLSRVDEIVKLAAEYGQPAIAVTDHGVCASHPHLQQAADKEGIKPIFGLEANFVDDRFVRGDLTVKDDAHRVRNDYRHLILWAMNDVGLRNLWAMSTEANRDGFYDRPRLDWSTLERLNEGVMASTACLRGPVNYYLLKDDEESARSSLARLMSIFDGRLYAELHTNDLPKQIRVNRWLTEVAVQLGIPMIAAVDSHYPCWDDKHAHRAWLAVQTNKELQDESDLFAGDGDYHLYSGKEVRQALRYLPDSVVTEAMANTLVVADRCDTAVRGKNIRPIFSKKGATEEERTRSDVDRLVDLCLSNWHKVRGKRVEEDEYLARFEHEMRLLIDKGFCGYFLMVSDYCLAAKEGRLHADGRRVLVGPGRGSGGGSLVAYLSGITEIDPVDADLLFERFMTEGRESPPDFDVDFPSSERDSLAGYVVNRYGEENVVRVGSHIHLKNAGVVKALARALKTTMDIDYRDTEAFSKMVKAAEAGEAGLGLTWEDLWAQHGEVLDPIRAKYPDLFAYADKLVGRLQSYGRHAAGFVISSDEPLTGRLPLRMAGEGENRQLVAEFDMDALEALGLLKFDLLNLRTLDTIQMCIDLVREQRGDDINIYTWDEEYRDPLVWEAISEGQTLGIFQIETRAGTKLTKRFRPQSVHDLADVITLVRPGPQRSGLTETYFRRRNGDEPVTYPDPRLEKVLAKTYGTILYQEDVMQTCMVLGGYTSNEADDVRKILGKKKVEAVAKAGEKFLARVIERGMAPDAAQHLWDQMAEFAKYSFNRAHAFGYAVLGYWTAWLKFHYPVQFLTAALSTVDEDRIPEFINDARRQGYRVVPPDVNESGSGFTVSGDRLAIRYGLLGVKGIGDKAVAVILSGQPYSSFGDFMERAKKGACDAGVVRRLAAVGAFDSLVTNRRALEARLDAEASGDAARCVHKDESVVAAHGLPCRFDWTNEPVELTATGKAKKGKPPPKKCTKACRNYTPPVLDFESLAPYDAASIRDREMEYLGVYLSSTPFDRLHPDDLESCLDAEEIESAPSGDHVVAAIVRRVRTTRDRHNKEMAFSTMFAQTGDIDVTIFKDAWAKYRSEIKPDCLCLAVVRKNDRGLSLLLFRPL